MAAVGGNGSQCPGGEWLGGHGPSFPGKSRPMVGLAWCLRTRFSLFTLFLPGIVLLPGMSDSDSGHEAGERVFSGSTHSSKDALSGGSWYRPVIKATGAEERGLLQLIGLTQDVMKQ